MRAYWTGGPLLDEIDRHEFGTRLLEYIGAQAGHYWRHVTPELLPEATATHGFHVFGVYPWSRLLGAASPQPLAVLDNCRIRWGQVLAVETEHVVVRSRRLGLGRLTSWDWADRRPNGCAARSTGAASCRRPNRGSGSPCTGTGCATGSLRPTGPRCNS